MKARIICFFAVFYCCQLVILLQSTTRVAIMDPPGARVVISEYYNKKESGLVGPGVDWIMSSKATSPTRFQSLFYASCTGSANLTISAASSFKAYLDGVYIGNGSNFTRAYNFPIKISCGNHQFTVILYSINGTNSGLTFVINQDQSSCYNCLSTGYWNEGTCSCQCISSCNCPSPKSWKGYPTCGCTCPPLIFIFPYATAAAAVKTSEGVKANRAASSGLVQLISFEMPPRQKAPTLPLPPPVSERIIFYCQYPRYYSMETCGCVCHYSYCFPRYYFNSQTCSCLPLLK